MKASGDADVVFALTGDVHKNSRAQRQLRVLSASGLRVKVLHLASGTAATLDVPNVTIHDLGAPRSHGIQYFWAIHRKFTRAARLIQARVFHASDLYVLPALSSAAAKYEAKIVYDARELYPFVVATIGRPWVRQFWSQVEGRYIQRADVVFTVSEGIADKLVDSYDIDRPVVIYNVPEEIDPAGEASLRETLGTTSHAFILHLGQLRPHRGCELLVEAMPAIDGGTLVFLGDGPLRPTLKQKSKALGIEERIRFLDPVPPDEVVAYARSADMGVSLLEDVCLNHRLALPNKLFEYLTAGLPVIASDLPEIRKVVHGYDVGQVVRPGNREDLVAALKQAVMDRSLRDRWKGNIPRVLETFNWSVASQDFLTAYNDLVQLS